MATMETAIAREVKMNNCENCKFREKYDHNPQSFMARLWKWHIGWCPGWKAYVKSLPEARRVEVLEKYNPASAA